MQISAEFSAFNTIRGNLSICPDTKDGTLSRDELVQGAVGPLLRVSSMPAVWRIIKSESSSLPGPNLELGFLGSLG